MPGWRRVLEDLSYSPVVSPLRGPARQAGAAAVGDPGRTRRSAHPDPGRRRGRVGDHGQQRRCPSGRWRDGRQRVDRRRATAAGRCRGRRIVRRAGPTRAPRRRADGGDARRRLEAARNAERTVTVSATALRPGDVIDLSAPDVVPADARLLVAEDLEVDESLLTGESLPVDKQVDPVAATDTERASMLFEGSTIVAGHARAIVVATGWAPLRTARSQRSSMSSRRPGCRRGCGS